jgi:hypothetical protein
MLLQLNTTLAYLSYLHWGHKLMNARKTGCKVHRVLLYMHMRIWVSNQTWVFSELHLLRLGSHFLWILQTGLIRLKNIKSVVLTRILQRERERERERLKRVWQIRHGFSSNWICSALLCACSSLFVNFCKKDWLLRWEIYSKFVLVTRILKKKRDAQMSAVADLEKINKRSDQRNNKQWFRFM